MNNKVFGFPAVLAGTWFGVLLFLASALQPAAATTASDVAVGSFHSCALTTAGGVKCWGGGGGQLGDGTTMTRTTPVDVCADATCGSFLSGVAAVSTRNNFHTCAVTTAGGVKCWGSNGSGQLGDGTTMTRTAPVDVCADATCGSFLSGVAAVSTGSNHTCVVTTAGGVKCWGFNGQGQLGDGTTMTRPAPVDVCADATCGSFLSGVATVAAGSSHTCAVTTAGGVKCWGFNGQGRLGDGTTMTRTAPVDVCADATCGSSLSGVVAVSPGSVYSCAVTTASGVKCWGQNMGRLGDGTTMDRTTPMDVCADATCGSSLSGVATVAAGADVTCAVTTAGGVKCWGSNGNGQLGDGTTMTRTAPVDVCADATCGSSLSGVAAVATSNHACALTTVGGVKCWGLNVVGELGDGTTTNRSTPVDVTGFETVVILLDNLVDDVIALDLQAGIETALDAKLDAIQIALNDLNQSNDVAACNSLETFISAVEAQRGKKISDADADALIAAVQEIIAMLSCV